MSCDAVRQLLLDLDLDEAGRQRVAAALKHLEDCQECRKAFADFDALHSAMALPDSEVEPIGGWTEFQSRLSTPPAPRRSVLPWFRTLAIAASGIVVAAAFEFGRLAAHPGERTPVATNVQPSGTDENDSHFAPGDLTHEISAFHQVSQVFDGRAGWMLVSNKTSDVGVADGDVDARGKVLLLRLTVGAAGEEISNADLLVVPGQTANLTVPLEGGNVLHYRIGTSTDEPTHLTIMLEMRTSAGTEPLAALSTDFRMQPGQKVTAGELCASSNKYVLKIGFDRASL